MSSYLGCFTVVTLGVLSGFLVSPASALVNRKYIDAVCQRVKDKSFCIQTLTTYPPSASATGLLPLAESVLGLAISHSEKTAGFIEEKAKKDASLKTQFNECHDAYVGILSSLKSAISELKESPDTSNYDVMVCGDEISRVKDLIERNADSASETVMEMTLQMQKLLDLAAGATDAVDDDDENLHRRG